MTEAPGLGGDPWSFLERVVDGPLHPGGRDATADLLDRAGVEAGTCVLDAGCGSGETLALARDRGARAIGVDARATGDPTVQGDIQALPLGTDTADVVVSECTLCLAADVDTALAAFARVLRPDGRLALSDVVVAGEVPEVPATLAEALCLEGRRDPAWLRERVIDAGFAVRTERDHREDLLAMRDRIAGRVDYDDLLRALGERGERVADSIERFERAIEDGRVGYVSLVATRESGPP